MSIIYIFVKLPALPWGLDRVFKYISFYAIGNALHLLKAENLIRKFQHVLIGFISFGLILLNFVLAYMGLYTGIWWFITATIGSIGLAIISVLINKNKVLEYFGRISLIILCIHGPVYRVVIKLISILAQISSNSRVCL